MRREFPDKIRVQIVMRAMKATGQIQCEGCGMVLAHKKFEIDHILPEGLADRSRKLTAEDGQLLGFCCHKPKTANDVRQIRKADRQRKAHFGIKARRQLIPGSKGTRWKRKISGETVPR